MQNARLISPRPQLYTLSHGKYGGKVEQMQNQFTGAIVAY